ncbi:MAG TPA: glycosyltransferase family 4 protein [Thermoleophilaceae bacterium]|nr:glycosyltransferase family 4 protein [Thermoleophilaceae bacterium]
MSDRPAIAFGSRELWPFVTGGGIGHTLHGALRLLGDEADVTLITREAFREQYEEMRAAGDPRLPHPRVRFEFVADPVGFDLGPFTSFMHCWSARVYERLCELYPDGGPDLVEFGDYMGEGYVTIQARRAGHPSLRRTTVAVRLHTSLEMVDWLDGRTDPDEERRAIYTLERGSLAFADELLSPGGDVLDAYRRFYGREGVAEGTVVPHVIVGVTPGPAPAPPSPDDGMRFLYVGRLERRKGVRELVEAAARLKGNDWQLTLLGGDTDTGRGGGSMRAELESVTRGHPQIRFRDRVPHDDVLQLIGQHHVVVIPSPWECWSSVAREALQQNRPVVASPVGALVEAVREGTSGWLMEGPGVDDIQRSLQHLIDSPREVMGMIAAGGPRKRFEDEMEPERTLAHYMSSAARSAPAPPRVSPAVTALVVCGPGSGPLARTLAGLWRQTVPIERTVVAADSLERVAGASGHAIGALAIAPEGTGRPGLIAAGAALAAGELVFLLEAGMLIDPSLLERLLEAFRWNPDAAYATSWAQGLDPSCVPLGNFGNRVYEYDNAAVTPLLRRELLEAGGRLDPALGNCAERVFYARLAADGLFGSVVPERLVRSAPFARPCRDGLALLGELTTAQPPEGFP